MSNKLFEAFSKVTGNRTLVTTKEFDSTTMTKTDPKKEKVVEEPKEEVKVLPSKPKPTPKPKSSK